MAASMLKVGIREFRSHLQQYLLMPSPISITRHGETVGYYIPTKNHAEKSDLHALKQAAEKFDQLLLNSGVTEDELFADFRALKSGKKK
jgi:hypothetical protein